MYGYIWTETIRWTCAISSFCLKSIFTDLAFSILQILLYQWIIYSNNFIMEANSSKGEIHIRNIGAEINLKHTFFNG